jgi:hypothetical protein
VPAIARTRAAIATASAGEGRRLSVFSIAIA